MSPTPNNYSGHPFGADSDELSRHQNTQKKPEVNAGDPAAPAAPQSTPSVLDANQRNVLQDIAASGTGAPFSADAQELARHLDNQQK